MVHARTKAAFVSHPSAVGSPPKGRKQQVANLSVVTTLADEEAPLLSPRGISVRQEKAVAMMVLKDLLSRKEHLLAALAALNATATAQARQVQTGKKQGAESDVPGGLDDTFQRQYAWVIVNLDITNRYLNATHSRLQDIQTSQTVRCSIFVSLGMLTMGVQAQKCISCVYRRCRPRQLHPTARNTRVPIRRRQLQRMQAWPPRSRKRRSPPTRSSGPWISSRKPSGGPRKCWRSRLPK